MTKENYTQFTNQELIETIQSIDKHPSGLNSYLKHKNPELLNELKTRTSFLDTHYKNKSVSIFERIYCLSNDIHEMPICAHPNCSNIVEWNNDNRLYRKYCCRKHCMSDPNMREKSKETKRIKYGDENYNNREKAKQTSNDRYGVEYPIQLKEIQEKSRRTCRERLGVDYPGQSKEVQEKMKETNRKLLGVDYPAQSKKIYDKIRQTSIEHHGGIGFASNELSTQVKISMLNKYGVEHPMQLSDVRNKIRDTIMNNFGVEHQSLSVEVRKKTKETLLRIYGVEYTFQSSEIQEKCRETKIKRYQDEHYSNPEKARRTMIEKYGVEWYSQTTEFHKKCRKPYTNPKYPDMTFGSSWEFKVYDFLTENNIQFEYQPGISIPYEYDGIEWTYHPDFRLYTGAIIEVKGDHYFRINDITGREEMYCPYGKNKLSKDKYEWLCGKFEAKHQCMIKHNIVIIRQKQLKYLNDIVNNIINNIIIQGDINYEMD